MARGFGLEFLGELHEFGEVVIGGGGVKLFLEFFEIEFAEIPGLASSWGFADAEGDGDVGLRDDGVLNGQSAGSFPYRLLYRPASGNYPGVCQ